VLSFSAINPRKLKINPILARLEDKYVLSADAYENILPGHKSWRKSTEVVDVDKFFFYFPFAAVDYLSYLKASGLMLKWSYSY
jgi:hypothetical protein